MKPVGASSVEDGKILRKYVGRNADGKIIIRMFNDQPAVQDLDAVIG